MAIRERVLSGMRPSGRLHLGNYLGALANWVTLQDDYDCFYFSADWHVLTDRTEVSDVPANTIEMAADWLGAGLDPQRSTPTSSSRPCCARRSPRSWPGVPSTSAMRCRAATSSGAAGSGTAGSIPTASCACSGGVGDGSWSAACTSR